MSQVKHLIKKLNLFANYISCNDGQQYLKVDLQIINEPKWSNSVDDFLIVVAAEVPETHLSLRMISCLKPLYNFIHYGNHVIFITWRLEMYAASPR